MVSIRSVKPVLYLAAALLSGFAGAENEVGPPILTLERTIPLADTGGRVDHLAVDLARKHLFVAELGNGTVDAIDLDTGAVVHRITGLKEPQGVGYAAGPDLVAVASAGDGSVRLFRGADFSPAGVIELGSDADDVRVDPRNDNFLVGYGEGGLAVIDAKTRSKLADIKLPAHPEGFQLDPATDRVFVNIPDARQIATVDLAAGAQVATWQTPGLRSNFPMAIDPKGGFVATVFRSPARIVLIDPKKGTILASADICGDADDVFFDPNRSALYVSCGSGNIDLLHMDAAGLSRATQVPTASGARTSLFVPELDRLFVASRAGLLGSKAAILVFRPMP